MLKKPLSYFYTCLIAMSSILIPPAALAKSYVGVDAFLLNFDIEDGAAVEEYDLMPVRLKYGIFNERTGKGFEIQLLTAADDSLTNDAELDYRLDLDTSIGAFFKYTGDLIYIMGGFAQLNTTYTYLSETGDNILAEDNVVSLAAGFGAHYQFANRFRVSVDYLFYLADSVSYPTLFPDEDPELSTDGLAVGINYSF